MIILYFRFSKQQPIKNYNKHLNFFQITAMANRTILVDNNTWNNTHISRVGQAMASDEDHAYEIMKELDVDYVLVIFGGLIGYSSDGNCPYTILKFN